MPEPPLPPELDEFLSRPNPAVIASLRPDGSPHTAATWYDWENGRVLVNMDEGRARLEYLRRDPRVSITVLGADDWYHHVTLRGRVVAIEEDPDFESIDRLSRRYTGQPVFAAGPRTFQRMDRDRGMACLGDHRAVERLVLNPRGLPDGGPAQMPPVLGQLGMLQKRYVVVGA